MKLITYFTAALLWFCFTVEASEHDTAELQPVSIKLQWQHQFQFAGIYAAQEKGFYRDAGFDVSILTGRTHPYDEVENGEVEFGISGTSIIVEYLKGRPLVALGATFQNSPYVWLVTADSGIYSAADFVGKTLTRQSYADDLAAIFLKQDINTDLINFIEPSATDIDNLIAGRVDGLTAYVSNEPFIMVQHQVPYRTIAPKDYGINFYSDILFTSRQFLEKNPETVKAFREATYKGWRYAVEHRNEIIDLILNKYNVQNKSRTHLQFEADQLIRLSLYPTVDFGHMTQDRWQQIADIYQELGLYDSSHGLEGFFYQDPMKDSNLFQWLAGILAFISIFTLICYLLKKHHNKILTEQIRQQTASLQDELRKREALEVAAHHESLRLQTLLDNTIDSVITINASGLIENYNKASIALFGYQPEEVLGQNITMLMPAGYRDLHKLGMARFMSTETSRILGKPIEVEARHKNGSSFPVELTISDFQWEGQYMFTGIARDISQQKTEQQALLEAKLEAERANNAKSEFLSAMSHELRTPLNGILGFSQLLLSDSQTPLSTQQLSNVKQIMHNGEHLLTLINDVLELSKIEAGNITTAHEPVAVANVIEQCLPMLQTLADNHDVHIKVLDTTDAIVMADFTKLKQVFINLVTNAIKYNKSGGKVLINASVQTHNNTFKLTVTDSGQGIAADKQAQVFTAFERLGQEHADIEGSGVGLSISKRLIDAMGGQINFTSTEGRGSSFWIELPLSAQQADTTNQFEKLTAQFDKTLTSRRTDSERPLHLKHVLYIEDNPANIRLIEVFFSRIKQVCLHTCESAETGLELLKTMRPDVILMDINLPGMSGIDAMRTLKETPEYADIAVIALSAAAMKENIDAADDLFKAYITKPVDFNLLTRALQPYL
ncbi:ABC transporter substrate-binding protein [Methylophaga sp. OBS4]|uniref:ABC transporter substrate-binding protein n=1 Tax=Methylophaga sp. OBS4 TaxID=2991935 RepID=UPI002257BA1D|nr:ABC transporter substrate-binding protein [Methylophaga sp. OBS4]MCX4187444.1 ABC transporter substrate-binding protein [Methylophaga sp. OBS4]